MDNIKTTVSYSTSKTRFYTDLINYEMWLFSHEPGLKRNIFEARDSALLKILATVTAGGTQHPHRQGRGSYSACIVKLRYKCAFNSYTQKQTAGSRVPGKVARVISELKMNIPYGFFLLMMRVLRFRFVTLYCGYGP